MTGKTVDVLHAPLCKVKLQFMLHPFCQFLLDRLKVLIGITDIDYQGINPTTYDLDFLHV